MWNPFAGSNRFCKGQRQIMLQNKKKDNKKILPLLKYENLSCRIYHDNTETLSEKNLDMIVSFITEIKKRI